MRAMHIAAIAGYNIIQGRKQDVTKQYAEADMSFHTLHWHCNPTGKLPWSVVSLSVLYYPLRTVMVWLDVVRLKPVPNSTMIMKIKPIRATASKNEEKDFYNVNLSTINSRDLKLEINLKLLISQINFQVPENLI